MLGVLEVVLPVFLVVGAGYAAVRSGLFPNLAVDGLLVYTQSFAVPVLLFSALYRLDLHASFDLSLLASYYAGSVICFALAGVLALKVFHRRPGESIAIAFAALFPNTVLLGLPIATRAYGADALAPYFAIIALHAPFCYLLGITAMEFARADGRGPAATAVATAKAMFRNALMIGVMLGLAANLAGIRVPEAAMAAVGMVSASALPTALFALGGVLTRYAIRSALGEAGMVTFISLMVHPAIGFVLATQVYDLSVDYVRAVVVLAAMAPGINAYVFANMYSRAVDVAASTVLIATGVSVLSVAFWRYCLRVAGY
jgi:predicted permease